MVGVEGVLVTFQSLLTLKKGTRSLDFQSNAPPLKFKRRPLPQEVPLGEKNNNNKTLEPYGLYYRQRYSVASDNKLSLALIQLFGYDFRALSRALVFKH